jgi:hypothetical protein
MPGASSVYRPCASGLPACASALPAIEATKAAEMNLILKYVRVFWKGRDEVKTPFNQHRHRLETALYKEAQEFGSAREENF